MERHKITRAFLLLCFLLIFLGSLYPQNNAVLWFQKGIKAKTPAEKIKCYSNAIKLDPSFVEAYYNLAYVYKKLGDLNKSEENFRKALLTNPVKISNDLKLKITYELGINYKKLGRYADAEEALLGAKNLAKRRDIRAKIFYELGRVYMLTGEYDKAIAQFNEGVLLNGSSKDKFNAAIKNAQLEKEINSYYVNGVKLAEAGNHQGAVEAFSKVISLNPNFKDAAARLNYSRNFLNNKLQNEKLDRLYYRGLGYAKNKDWKNAISTFQEIVRIDPTYKDASKQLVDVRNKFEQSFQEETLKKYYDKGMAAYRRGQWVNAIVSFEKVKELDPNYKDVMRRIREVQNKLDHEDENVIIRQYYSRGVDALKVDDWETAINNFERVIRLDPNYRNAASLLKEAHIGLENKQEMEMVKNYYDDGLEQLTRGDWLKAIVAFEKVREIDPSYKDVVEKIALAKENMEKFNGAGNVKGATIAKEGTRADGSSRGWITLGAILTAIIIPVVGTVVFSPTARAKLLLLQGKYDQASRVYEQLLYKRPEKLKLYITLANIYLIANRTDKTALRVYETVLQMNISPQLKQKLNSIISNQYLNKAGDSEQRLDILEDELRKEINKLGHNA